MSLAEKVSLWVRTKYYPDILLKNQSFEEASIADWIKETSGLNKEAVLSKTNFSVGTWVTWATHGSYHLHLSLNYDPTLGPADPVAIYANSYARAKQNVDCDKLEGIIFDYYLAGEANEQGLRVFIGNTLLFESTARGEFLNKILRWGVTGIQALKFEILYLLTYTVSRYNDSSVFLIDNIREIRRVYDPK